MPDDAKPISSPADMVHTIPPSVRRLSWFNGLAAVAAVIPCCFPVYSSFVFNVIFEWNLRYLSADTPPDGFLTFRDMVVLPWALAYLAHVILLGIPMVVAAVVLRRNARLGWQISLGVVTMQAVMVAANVAAALFVGRGAWRALGPEVTAALFIGGTVLLLADVFLLWQGAEVLKSDRN